MEKNSLVANFEKLFGAQYCERGREYYREGAVNNLVRDKNIVTARVEGNRLYRVTIDLDSKEMSCSCPCDFNCKHMAAVLYALRANKADDAEKLFAPLKAIPKEELEETIKKMVLEDPELAIYINTDDSVLEKEIRQLWPTTDDYGFQAKIGRLYSLIAKKSNPLNLEMKFFRKLFDIYEHAEETERIEDTICKILEAIKKELQKPENKKQKKKVLNEIKKLVKDYDWFLDAIE